MNGGDPECPTLRAVSLFPLKRNETATSLKRATDPPLGTRLVDECVRFSRAAGYQKITLWTQSNLLAARHLYRTAGFTCVAHQPHHSFGKDLVAETWELVL